MATDGAGVMVIDAVGKNIWIFKRYGRQTHGSRIRNDCQGSIQAIGIDVADHIIAARCAIDLPDGHRIGAALDGVLNRWVVLTLIAMAAGEIVTPILVAESVQVSVELEAEVLALVLVQVMVVVVGAWLQEASPTRVIKETNNARRFTALSLRHSRFPRASLPCQSWSPK